MLARYDLEKAARSLNVADLAERSPDMWRYHELLPVSSRSQVVSLGEGMSPLRIAPASGARFGLHLFVKDEGTNPTGSFKSRGMATALSMARHLGVDRVVIPTAGSAGGAAAAYAARAGIACDVFIPADAPAIYESECRAMGARVTLVDGTLHECGAAARAWLAERGGFDLSTFREPYRAEGKKTMAFELFEQMDGVLPDAIVYPTGGGTGLVAMWKAFDEMQQIGWIGSARPRLISVQADGCAPLVKAFEEGREEAEVWENPTTQIPGLRAPKVLADFLCLRAIRESGGLAIAASDAAIFGARAEVFARDGILMCPEGAACFAALEKLSASGELRARDRVVLFNTASGLKYAPPPPTGRRGLDPPG